MESRGGSAGKLHADKAYDAAYLREWLTDRGITPRISRKGIDPSTKLGKHRWIIERTMSWLFNYRRLTIRYERHATNFLGFITLAAALICHKKLAKSTT
jgi:transposase